MKKRILLLTLFAVVAASAGYGIRTALTKPKAVKSPAYTITWQVTDYYEDGTNKPRYLETRYVSSSGKWHSIKDAGVMREESFAEVGKGVYIKRNNRLEMLSGYQPPHRATEDELLKSPNFLRVDTVLGYKAIVVGSGNRPRTGSEFWVVPALGGETIKIVLRSNPAEMKTVYEPVSLTMGEPDPSLVTMRELPVDKTVKSNSLSKPVSPE